MLHEDILSLADDYVSGRLNRKTQKRLQNHLDTCEDCRGVIQAWDLQAPVPALKTQVMAALREQARPGWRPWWATLASATALLLLVTAFWQPERAWVKADKGFAARDLLSAQPLPGESHE